jgi:xylulokinase
VLEGVAFGLKDGFALIEKAGLGSIEQVRVSGGGAKSSLWRQILADVLGVELVTVNTTEGAAYGAALLAGVGEGTWQSVEAACAASINVVGRVSPDGQGGRVYEELYYQYRALYPALRQTFNHLSAQAQVRTS